MMKNRFLKLASLVVACFSTFSVAAQSETVVSLGGNAYITKSQSKELYIDEHKNAICNWNDTSSVISFYFKPSHSGKMTLALQANGHSVVEVSLLGEKKEVAICADSLTRIEVGTFNVLAPNYVKVDIRGVKINHGAKFGNVAALVVGGDVNPLAYVDSEFSTHFGRRGPSVHLGYVLPKEDIQWFYNEVVVPEEGDIPSSYYMACGFGEGYFGMQNNSPERRRVLFSVWSPYETDNAAEIPDSLRIVLLKKGAGVTVQDFGNEGSGGQSFMHYDWKAGELCRFLMGVKPDGKGNTVYTAYFFDNTKGKWSLVASFRRPNISTWYTNAHSFLENFNPKMGYQSRKAYYGNQWACTVDGKWLPVKKARFTCDATGRQKQRLDYKGGVEAKNFFLQMGGFFDDLVEPNVYFERGGNVRKAPKIDFSTLE